MLPSIPTGPPGEASRKLRDTTRNVILATGPPVSQSGPGHPPTPSRPGACSAAWSRYSCAPRGDGRIRSPSPGKSSSRTRAGPDRAPGLSAGRPGSAAWNTSGLDSRHTSPGGMGMQRRSFGIKGGMPTIARRPGALRCVGPNNSRRFHRTGWRNTSSGRWKLGLGFAILHIAPRGTSQIDSRGRSL